jgi:hypothetical protein
MAALALDYLYRYAFPSELAAAERGPQLRLATSGGIEEHPYFFKGKLTKPKPTADLLRGLVQIVQSRFHVPPAMLERILQYADPVITSGGDRLRFEVFSGCASTYARLDLLPEAIDGEFVGRGTTNVDFNSDMRAALARIRDTETVDLSVGADTFELARPSQAVVERKVALPLRWLKGFVEVQAYQARMARFWELSGSEAQRFLRSLPRSPMKSVCWVVAGGSQSHFPSGLRTTQRETKGGIPVGGLHRLRVLEDLSRYAKKLRIYADPSSQTSGWELDTGSARFDLVLSPEVWRGFSGEGQVLADLAGKDWQTILPRIQASLKWDAKIDATDLGRRFKLDPAAISAALSALGSRGLVGFDLAEEQYFHRELPFDLSRIEALQPRLKDARKLVEAGGIRISQSMGEYVEASVQGSGVEHRVRLTSDGAKCTCPWFAKHQGKRGPCKHVLAVQILLDKESKGNGS